MRKRINKLCVGLTLVLSACFTCNAVSSLVASASTVNNTVDTVAFAIDNGASVRLDENGNGIRYHVAMPADEHTALEENTAYSSVVYGILVAPADYEKTYGALNKANVFGLDNNGNTVTAKYDWAVKDENGDWQYDENSSKTRIMNFRTGTLTEYTAKNGDSRAGYYGSIVNLNEDNIVRDFVGVGYIQYTEKATGKTNYVFAERNDNVRSMAEVARLAIASDEVSATDKALLKQTYLSSVYDEYLQFDTAGSKQIAKGSTLSWDSIGENDYAVSALIKNDDFDADGEGTEDTTTTGRQDLVIDMGGVYKVKEIESISVKYRFLNTSSGSLQVYINGDTMRLTGLSYVGENEKWYTATETESFSTLTIPQSSLKANSLNGGTTLLSEEDYLSSINFGTSDWRNSSIYMQYRMMIQIDSIEVNLIPEYHEEYLEFNDDNALEIVNDGLDAQIVDLGDGNKALQATYKYDNYNDGTPERVFVDINLGGLYKVSEIKEVVICYKNVGVETTAGSIWPRVFVNNEKTEGQQIVSNSGINLKWGIGTSKIENVMTSFNTVTITNAGLLTRLSADDYLTAVRIGKTDGKGNGVQERVTIQIDYIRIVLKSGS
ncbi:MAG: hypothetical protein IKL76_00725 [Clostridia bacterium]|nr:hypothetical protein [Clostridia bacterium]